MIKSKLYSKYLENRKEILEKYKNGFSGKELAEEYNIVRQCLYKYLKLEGIETIKRGQTTKRMKEKNKKTMMDRYGVENPGQSKDLNKEKGEKISKFKKDRKDWVGENNPNYGNKIGKNNGFKFGIREDIGKYFFRSSWEANVARILNFYNIKWEYEPNRYKINEKETYTPDFYLPEYDLFLEVKGYWRDDAKRKFNSFLEKYDFKIKLVDGNFYYWIINRNKDKVNLLEGVK